MLTLIYILLPHLVIALQVNAYDNADIALLCGSMLRECVRYESLARATLNDAALWKFFDVYVHLPNFDVASDAFATLRDLLTRNKGVASEFLSERCVSTACCTTHEVPYVHCYTICHKYTCCVCVVCVCISVYCGKQFYVSIFAASVRCRCNRPYEWHG
jgi:Mo25-like